MPPRHPTRPSSRPPARRPRPGLPGRPAQPARPRPRPRLTDAARRAVSRRLRHRSSVGRQRWIRWIAIAVAIPIAAGMLLFGFYYFKYARLIDARLGGEERVMPRIYGRPFDLAAGVPMSIAELEQRLSDDGYAERPKAESPGEFSATGTTVTFVPQPQGGRPASAPVRVDFSRASASGVITRLTAVGAGTIDHVALAAPLLSELASGERSRYVPLSAIPRRMVEAVLAIEDKRFYEHPGVDPIRAVGALINNLRGKNAYLEGGSTLTQQIVKNTFLTPEKTFRRKIAEQLIALVVETRLTKDQILELYLNETVVGQRGPFEIHGVAEGARLFFGKDIANVTLAEAATIAGVIHSPSSLSPFRHPDKAIERRNVVLHEIAVDYPDEAAAAARAAKEPLVLAPRALENEAPYFVDYVSAQVDDLSKNLLKRDRAVDVYTTIDLHLQRIAQEAVAAGITQVDKQVSKKKQGQVQSALVAIDPRTGDILAMVGGRAYYESQYNRAVASRRQPGSVFKPFVYLAAFEEMADEGRGDLTPATIMVDEPTTFMDGDKPYSPSNYNDEYGGPVTLRNALAHSRNVVAIKVAMQTGLDKVADLWKRVGVGTEAKPYPSIALGVFEATPIEIAKAYTIFPDGGVERPLRAITRLVASGRDVTLAAPKDKTIARPQTTFLVTNMMRSVLNEGTGAGARADGFTLDAAGKTGTTQDLRDAWFVGFTPELLTVVWVGLDNNQPIGLSGTQAALPIWTAFMKRALAGHKDRAFEVPDGITFADIDRDNGKLATPLCPNVIHEAFLPGTEPKDYCDVHGGDPHASILSKLGRLFGKIIRD